MDVTQDDRIQALMAEIASKNAVIEQIGEALLVCIGELEGATTADQDKIYAALHVYIALRRPGITVLPVLQSHP